MVLVILPLSYSLTFWKYVFPVPLAIKSLMPMLYVHTVTLTGHPFVHLYVHLSINLLIYSYIYIELQEFLYVRHDK